MKFMRRNSPFLLILIIFLASCSRSSDEHQRSSAVYYWRTSFHLSDTERDFLIDNKVSSMYVKFFDIIASGNSLRPEATLLFTEKFPEGIEIIPTVFIDSRALDNALLPPSLPSMLLGRIDSMMTKNGYSPASEIQIDFDWTRSNREKYFNLLSRVSDLLHNQGRRLSVTVRLHQLSQPEPPADSGVLMVYNTGNFASPSEKNSILSTASIRPYLPYLEKYRLPLATALPLYDWNLLFRDGQFIVIARGIEHSDTSTFSPLGNNLYLARRYIPVPSSSSGASPGARIIPGDILRHEEVSAALLDSVINSIKSVSPEVLDHIILYHLDEKSLCKYSSNEINQIYNHM